GRRPVPELAVLGIAQSTRGYTPATLSHYRASWVNGSDIWPVPVWPMPPTPNMYLYGARKATLQTPLTLHCSLSVPSKLTIHVRTVSALARLLVRANGMVVMDKRFEPGPGSGEWKQSEFKPQWKIYQADYDRDYMAVLPPGTKEIAAEVMEGDWLTFSSITVDPYPGAPAGRLVLQPGSGEWGVRQEPMQIESDGRL